MDFVVSRGTYHQKGHIQEVLPGPGRCLLCLIHARLFPFCIDSIGEKIQQCLFTVFIEKKEGDVLYDDP